MHSELKVGTLAGLLRQADVTADDFIEALKGGLWRICSEWPDGQSGPSNVEIVDHH